MYQLALISINVAMILLEILFIWFLIIRIKNIKNNQIILFIGLFISYFISGFLISANYDLQMYFYIMFNIFAFITLKLLYKDKIYLVDFFLIGYIGFLLTFINLTFVILWRNEIISEVIMIALTRILILFVIWLVTKIRVFKYYSNMVKLWDRRDDGRIKAITVRNLILIMTNIGLYITNILLYIYIIR